MRNPLTATFIVMFLGCSGPSFYYTDRNENRIVKMKKFSLPYLHEKEFFIWGMRNIPSDSVNALIVTQLKAKGYETSAQKEADFWVSVHVFTSGAESNPQSITVIMKVTERANQCVIWCGQAELINPDHSSLLEDASKLKTQIMAFISPFPMRK